MTDTPAEALKAARNALLHVRGQLEALEGRTKGDNARLGDIRWSITNALALSPQAPSPTFGEGIEAAAKVVRDRATFWRSRRGRCSPSLEAECIDLVAAIRKLGE
jgi:hypothetical protein